MTVIEKLFWGVFTFVFITPLCGFIFRCGCTWLWSGAVSCCNINHPQTPNCPWCTASERVFLFLPGVIVFLGQIKIVSKVTNRFGKPTGFISGLAAFVILGILVGFIYNLNVDYPYFLWWSI